MKTIKEIISNIDVKKEVTNVEVVCMSVLGLYKELKAAGDIRGIRRLKLLMYYYPSMIERCSFSVIERCVKEPERVILQISNERGWLHEHEKYAINKNSRRLPAILLKNRKFLVSDFFNFFDI